jgi:hypothetical protein
LIQILAATFKRLLRDHCPPVTLHRGIVRSDKLRRHHALQFIIRMDSREASGDRGQLLIKLTSVIFCP